MEETTRSILIGLSALYVLAAAAGVLTLVRPVKPARADRLNEVVNVFLLTIAGQCFHFLEEYVTGFHLLFPRLLGLAPWPAAFFVGFNLSWIGIGAVAAVGMRRGYRVAFFPAWFFALAMLGNGVAHPLMAVVAGGYFPGLFTSFVVGILGYWLLRRLFRLTTTRAH